MPEDMNGLSSISDHDLRVRLSAAVGAEQSACANVIAHLAELDRRRLYLDDACSSLLSFCTERLGYSEDGATKRMRVARLVQRVPRALDELASGAIHLTGLFLLARHLTEENAEQLLGEARGKSKRQIEELLARCFPRSDVLSSITPVVAQSTPTQASLTTCSGASAAAPPLEPRATPAPLTAGGPAARARISPLSAASFRVEFTASRELREKIERAQNLLSHAVPSRDLAGLFERAIDALLETEMKRRFGARDPGTALTSGKRRKRRASKRGSRHVPVEVQRAVRERDGEQCTFTNAHGQRCSERRFLTIEHIVPFAAGGPTSVENCCLLCSAHNQYRARRVFGDRHIARKQAEAREVRAAAEARRAHRAAEAESAAKVQSALTNLGFKRRQAQAAIERALRQGAALQPESLLRATLVLLVPP